MGPWEGIRVPPCKNEHILKVHPSSTPSKPTAEHAQLVEFASASGAAYLAVAMKIMSPLDFGE